MDPGEYETNTLLINNISAVLFKIYEPVLLHSPNYISSASIVECALRKEGNLAYADPLRRVIWCFSLAGHGRTPFAQPGEPVLGPDLDLCGCKLTLVEEGALEPIHLLKARFVPSNSLNTPNSSSTGGPALDKAIRSAHTPGGMMTAAVLPPEGDTKTSFGLSVDSKGYGSIPAKDIHEYFIAAVVASLSYEFCCKTGATPLDSRSFVLPSTLANLADIEPTQLAIAPLTASLRVHLTTTGSLLIGISLSLAQGLCVSGDGLNMSVPPIGATVLAAPFGLFGTLQGLNDSGACSVDGSTTHSPDTPATHFRSKTDNRDGHWRSSCYELLEMRGISTGVLNKSSWLSIQFLRPTPIESRSDGKHTPVMNPQTRISWPAALCFRQSSSNSHSMKCIGDPGGTNFKDGFDALKHAKNWYSGNGSRQELIAKKKMEREMTSSKDAAGIEARSLQQNNGSSPPGMRRASNPGAGSVSMYPTPPDGVQNLAGVTPSVDGNTSSPAIPAPSAALVDIDTTVITSGTLGDTFGDGWDGAESRRDQSFVQGENWQMNNDVFVDNDITDADFNFFDEQPGPIDASVPDLSEMNSELPNLGELDQLEITVPMRPPDNGAHIDKNSPAPPVFAKPEEIRYARSGLGDHRQRDKKTSPSRVKRQPSPFDPASVYKRLKASIVVRSRPSSASSVHTRAQQGGVFERLDFNSSVTSVNQKYQYSGRFDCQWESREESRPKRSRSPPRTDYLRRHRHPRPALKDLPADMFTQITRTAGTVVLNCPQPESPRCEDSTSDADEISLVSDQDDVSDFSAEPLSPIKLTVRRRRAGDDNEPLAPSVKDIDAMVEQQNLNSEDLLKLSMLDHADVAITRYFAVAEPVPDRPMYGDDDLIMIAQILTEQAVSGSLKIILSESTSGCLDPSGSERDIVYSIRNSVLTLQAILPPCLQCAEVCQLRRLLEVSDIPLLATPSRMQPRSGGGPDQRPSVVQIPPPHLELRRYESKLSVLPSAVKFWESLGLGPAHGTKDVHSVCVFPNLDGIADNAGLFLDRLRSLYESLKLGTFERMPSSANMQNGLISYEVDKTSNAQASSSQGSRFGSPAIEDMSKLATAFFNSTAVCKNFVIFFVYTPDNPNTIVDACAAFQRLFDIHSRVLAERKKSAQNDLVLQLVSLDQIATSTSMVVLEPHEYTRICLETYDRCTLFGGPMPSPAIVLEQPMTRGIDFQLRSLPSSNILQENSCMHIAYAQSVDERWISAAWSDNRGCKQMTASYCLGRKGKPLSRGFFEIAQEIWTTTTCDLISIWKVHWRIIITKIGPMDQQEVNDWTTLAHMETKSSVTVTLLNVDTAPSLQLVPSIPRVPMSTQSAFYSTPVSTPQSSMISPEQMGNPSTPMGAPTSSQSAITPGAENNPGETDSDASLVDITDITWGVIASHRLNVSHSLIDPNPSLVSGYLIKRGGNRAEDRPIVMEVNLIHNEGNPRMHEMLLRDILAYFRGLGTVARARSVTDQEGDVRPWHVAAAEKAVQVLYQLM